VLGDGGSLRSGKNRQWSMVNGKWSMVNGQWLMVNGKKHDLD
jgi:hypothetical protein